MDQVQANTGIRPADPQLDQQWRNFMNQHYQRMVDRTRADLEDRIDGLSTLWENRLVELIGPFLNRNGTNEIHEAFNVITLLGDMRSRLDTDIWLSSDFWSDGGSDDDPDSDDPDDPDWVPGDGSDGDSDGSDPWKGKLSPDRHSSARISRYADVEQFKYFFTIALCLFLNTSQHEVISESRPQL